MDETSGRSCWGVAAWTVGAFCVLLAFGLLFGETGGGETLAMTQAASGR